MDGELHWVTLSARRGPTGLNGLPITPGTGLAPHGPHEVLNYTIDLSYTTRCT